MSLLPSHEKSDSTRVSGAGRWPSTGLAGAVLLGVVLGFYHGLWLPGQVLIKRDAFRYYLPLKEYLVERLSTGELPQWFPYEALGCPFIGVAGIGIFHPFTMLYFLFSAPDAYRISTLISCLMAALGAFALGRLLNISHAGSLLSGIAFALSGYVVSLTDNILYLYSVCALPIFCAATEKALTTPRSWMIAPAVVWATVFLNGDIQTGYYYGFIALTWALARAPSSYRETGLRLGLACALVALLASVQLGPSWAGFTSSERGHTAIFEAQAMHWSTHPLRLLVILASPGLETDISADMENFFFGARQVPQGVGGGLWAERLYLGIPVTGLAFLGGWYRRDLRVLALLAVLTLLFALGPLGGLYTVFYHTVPFWSAFRYPEKFMGIASFAMAMLAGAGLDILREGRGPLTPWLGVAILCVAAGLGLRTETAGFWASAHFGGPASLAATATGMAGLAFFYSAAVALGIWLIATGIKTGRLRGPLVIMILMTLVTLDLSRANLGAYHTAQAEASTFVPPFAQAITAREGMLQPGRFRLFSIPEDKTAVPPHLLRWLGADGAASIERRQALDLEHNAQFHLETLNTYIVSHSSAFRGIFKTRMGVAGAARYNVAYYIGHRVRVKDPQFASTLLADLPHFGLALFGSSVPVKPRAYLSQRPERADSPADPAVFIPRPDFQSGEVDIVETPDTTLPGPALRGSAAIQRYAPEEVLVRVETPQPAVLILLDAFDKGWTATLENGRDLPIMRANALARAVVVPAGAHLVTFRYETPFLQAGTAASLAGVVLCLAMIVQARRPPRRSESRA